MRFRTFCLSAVAVLVGSAPAAAAGLAVPMDQVRILSFAQPVNTVYVGNPMIADVTVIDSRHVFVLGKSYGSTNLIALDAQGKAIANDQVTVMGSNVASVTLQRGAGQVTYACAARRCEPAPMPGDDKDAFATEMGEVAVHQASAKSASTGNTNNTPE